LLMQLKYIYHLNEDQKQKIRRIIGVYHKKPYSYAQLNNDGYWEVLESKQRAPINGATSLKKIHKLSDWNNVLEYYNNVGLLPYCPLSDISPDKQYEKQSVQNNNKDILHRRRQPRKNVNLTGKVINKRNLKETEVLINDLSFDGTNFSPVDDFDCYVDDTVYLEFWLKNKNKSKIERNLKIKHVTHKNIGGEFVNKPQVDTELGFYLMFEVK